ncbi:MAG: cyclase family protein, partial [Calditrichaeota bacterium]
MTALSLLALQLGCSSPEPDLLSGRVVDLSYAYDENTVFWPTAKAFQLEVVHAGKTDAGYFYAANNFCTAEHGGTHIDAPYHFAENGNTVDAIPLERLMGEGVVVDVSEKCQADRDYRVQVADFTDWEQKHGERLDDKIVLLRTGFGRYWPDRVKYMGTD